jgi:cell division septum initiation protein DivIVA
VAEHGAESLDEPKSVPPAYEKPVAWTDAERHVSAAQLRVAPLGRELVGGYSRDEVDSLLERAAKTIDDFGRNTQQLLREIDSLQATQQAGQAAPAPTNQEIAHEMFVTAHRAIEMVKEEARQEAEQTLADAQAQAATLQANAHAQCDLLLEQTRKQAEAMLAEANRQADLVHAEANRQRAEAERLKTELLAATERANIEEHALRAAIQQERERILAESVADAEAARTRAEAEKNRLELTIADMRGAWVDFIGDALSRLEVISPEEGSKPASEAAAGAEAPAAQPPEETRDVMTELRDRLPGSNPTDPDPS